MWYPEEAITYCCRCEDEIPADSFWRGRGVIISGDGGEARTAILYSQCPECGLRLSVGLDGPWWQRVLYSWLWRLRYPATRAPKAVFAGVDSRPRRAAGG